MKPYGCHPRHWPAAALLILYGALGALAGCGGPSENLLAVTGAVTLDGKPLKVGTVSLRPDAAKGNTTMHHPAGVIDAAGNYQIFTTGRKGAPPGWYKVLVFADEQSQPDFKGKIGDPIWMTHIKYTNERTSGLAFEVVDKPSPGSYDLKVTKK